MIKSFNAPSPEAGPALLEPTITGNGEHEQALGADDKSANNVEYVSETPGPDKAAHALKKDPIVLENDDKGNVMQLSSGEDFTGRVSTTSPPEGAVKNNNVREIIPDVPGEDSKIDLIAKIDETIKTVRAMQQEKPVLRRRRPAATWTAYGNEDNAGIQRSSIDEERGWSTEPQETVTAAGTIETSVTDIPEKNETADEPAPVVMAEEHAEASPIVMAERPPEPETITIEENLNKIDQPLRGGEEHKVGLVVKNKKSSKTRLLAKIETPRTPEIREKIKTPEPAATQQLAPKIALLVKGGNFNKNKNISRGRDNTSRSNDLLKRWKYIGSVQNGILLYIDPDTISYPSEQVVNVLMRASVNNTEYIDMLAINCSESMLRILEERNGNNPVMSAYSDEWSRSRAHACS